MNNKTQNTIRKKNEENAKNDSITQKHINNTNKTQS